MEQAGPLVLAGLFVQSMNTLEAAVLLHLNPLAVVNFVFLGYVVTSLATFAGERHLDALVTWHFLLSFT